jgi:hypothetical protein
MAAGEWSLSQPGMGQAERRSDSDRFRAARYDRRETGGDKHRRPGRRGRLAVAVQHGSAAPAAQQHQVALVAAGGPEGVGPRVAERMRVQVRNAGVGAAAPQHRLNPISIKGRAASAAQPQPQRVRVRVSATLAQVAIQRPGRLDPKWDRPVPGTAAPARLAGHVHDPVPQVDVRDLEAGQLREPQPAVQEQHDDGRVPAGREVGPCTGGEQGPQVRIRQDRRLGIARSRCPDPGRGVVIGLALEPPAEVPHPGEPSSRRVAGAALADLDQPAPDVLAVQLGWPDLGVVLGQPVGQAAHRVLIGLDGVVGVAVGS